MNQCPVCHSRNIEKKTVLEPVASTIGGVAGGVALSGSGVALSGSGMGALLGAGGGLALGQQIGEAFTDTECSAWLSIGSGILGAVVWITLGSKIGQECGETLDDCFFKNEYDCHDCQSTFYDAEEVNHG